MGIGGHAQGSYELSKLPDWRRPARTLAGEGQLSPASPAVRRFQLVLIKPSHYGDDGYVIRWWRAMIPSNSLAAVFGVGRA
jgi:hypothetical protein